MSRNLNTAAYRRAWARFPVKCEEMIAQAMLAEAGQGQILLPDIKMIHPSMSPAYSPNLHAWMRKQGDPKRTGVYRIKSGEQAGMLHIGYVFDGEFIGSRLMQVLCYGAGAQCWSYTSQDMRADNLELLPAFWLDYLCVGRCAIDPEHETHFIGDRYEQTGDIRTCLWCGAQHRRTVAVEMVPVERERYELIQ